MASGGDVVGIIGTSAGKGDVSGAVVADISAAGAVTSGAMVEDTLAVWGADAPVEWTLSVSCVVFSALCTHSKIITTGDNINGEGDKKNRGPDKQHNIKRLPFMRDASWSSQICWDFETFIKQLSSLLQYKQLGLSGLKEARWGDWLLSSQEQKNPKFGCRSV